MPAKSIDQRIKELQAKKDAQVKRETLIKQIADARKGLAAMKKK